METDELSAVAPRASFSRRASLGMLAGTAVGVLGVGRPGVAAADRGRHTDEFAGSTWSMTVRFPDGLENPTYIQFTSTGEVVETNALTRSMGLGEWKRSGPSQYEYFFWEQIFDADNALTSVVRVAHAVTVHDQGASLTGDGIGTVFDLTGQQIAEVATEIRADRLS